MHAVLFRRKNLDFCGGKNLDLKTKKPSRDSTSTR
jgi:hypothetical protein